MKFFHSFSSIKSSSLAAYMAGLFESDACLTPRYKTKEDKLANKPRTYEFHFSFNKDDLPFAQYLRDFFDIGQITIKKGEHCVVWSITSISNVINLLSFINGYIRGPKIIIIQQAINFANNKYNLSIPLLPLNKSPLLSNAWLAGFSDGDSSLKIDLKKREPNTVSLIISYSLEVAEFYIKHEDPDFKDHKSNILYMEPLAKELNTSLEFIERKFKSLKVRATRPDNLKLLIDYFSLFPLFSSKYLNYLDWLKIKNIRDNAKINAIPYIHIYDQVEKIKNGMNSKRDPSSLTWNHLDNFYKIPSDYPNHPIKLWKRK